MVIVRINKENNNLNEPNYEIEESCNRIALRIAVPGASSDEISVKTIGTQLFVMYVSTKKLHGNVVKIGGSSILPPFNMEFTVDTRATIGAPFMERGVLTVPLEVNPDINMKARDYSVREITNADNTEECFGNWIFKDAHK